MVFESIKEAYQDIKRLKHIASVLFRHDLGFYVYQLGLHKHLKVHQRIKGQPKKTTDIPVKLRQALEELGPTFIKLGQLLSLRPDLIPNEYCEEFKKLQDNIKPFPTQTALKILQEELKKKKNEIFLEFSEKPIASASIGQVYKAKLLNKEEVVVKIQRPGIKETIQQDIHLLKHLIVLVEKYSPELKKFNLQEILKEFERYTKNEIDYLKEGRNIQRFYEMFKTSEKVKTPKPYWDYTSKRVLTMSYIDGICIDDKAQFKSRNYSNEKVANNLADCFMGQVIDHGFFHADPHPANVFVLSRNRIALLDFGIVGRLDDELRKKLTNVFIALTQKDMKKVVQGLKSFGVIEKHNENLEEELDLLISEYGSADVNQVDISSLFKDFLDIALKYNMKLPVNFVLLTKAIITCEAVGRSLYPDFNLGDYSKKYVEKLMQKKYSIENLTKQLKNNIINFSDLITNLPQNINKITNRLQKGDVKLDIEDTDVKQLSFNIGHGSNKITMGLITAALIVGSALVLQTGRVKWIAVFGFLMATILSIILTISIIKER